ncbi:MAG: 3-methyl-2-oxobutanoate hydroxymethyltransferase, partial [Pseudobutyrivibrio sp.]|nr:3-methyl-2-oxobutanoate hydroxymethyltransferase [Pseudobutyrivibrio sp.]
GAECDGQVLVLQDMLGMLPQTPKFVKRYAEIGAAMKEAFNSYHDEVQNGSFPTPAHTYPQGDC